MVFYLVQASGIPRFMSVAAQHLRSIKFETPLLYSPDSTALESVCSPVGMWEGK
jgi:hypothetical protein